MKFVTEILTFQVKKPNLEKEVEVEVSYVVDEEGVEVFDYAVNPEQLKDMTSEDVEGLLKAANQAVNLKQGEQK